jgi:Helicase conserved C-terminal domain
VLVAGHAVGFKRGALFFVCAAACSKLVVVHRRWWRSGRRKTGSCGCWRSWASGTSAARCSSLCRRRRHATTCSATYSRCVPGRDAWGGESVCLKVRCLRASDAALHGCIRRLTACRRPTSHARRARRANTAPCMHALVPRSLSLRLLRARRQSGYPCLSLHGGKDQSDRESTINDFKGDVCNVLVATSVAARGLDVKARTPSPGAQPVCLSVCLSFPGDSWSVAQEQALRAASLC